MGNSFADGVLILVGALVVLCAASPAGAWLLNWGYIYWHEQRERRAIARLRAKVVIERVRALVIE